MKGASSRGCDTGFFQALERGHLRAQQIWNEARKGAYGLVASTITINELLAIYYRQGMSKEGEDFVNWLLSQPFLQFVPVTVKIAWRSAGYRVGLNLSIVDSIILVTAVEEWCEALLTTDSDFEIAGQQGIVGVELLQ